MNGVTFGDKHSYNDWGLITKSAPVISPPSPKTNYIDIPEADGQLDLTEALTGEVKYDNRNVSFEFTVIDSRKRWTSIYSEMLNYLHGKKMKITLDEDTNHYYVGRCTVDSFKSEKVTATVAISGTVEPYKLDKTSSLDDWEWDSFNFDTDVIRGYSNLAVDGSLTVVVVGTNRSVIPTFIVDGENMKVEFEGKQYNLPSGRSKVADIIVKNGEKTVAFTGNGTVSIEFRGGSL